MSGVGFIERYLYLEPCADRQELRAVRFSTRLRLAGGLLMRGFGVQFLRSEPCLEHRVPRLLDERGDVYSHWADEAAPAAHIAAIEQ